MALPLYLHPREGGRCTLFADAAATDVVLDA